MSNFLLGISKTNKQLIMMFFDAFFVILILFLSFFIRIGSWNWMSDGLVIAIFSSPIIAVPTFYRFGLYRNIIRFIGFNTIWTMVKAISLYSLMWGIVGYMAAIEGIPRSVIIINWLLSIVVLGGFRVGGQWLLNEVINVKNINSINVIIYGAGSAGRQLSTMLTSTNFKTIAFIDDSLEINNKTINAIEVFLPNHIDTLINKKKVKEIFLAIPSLSSIRRREIVEFLQSFNLPIKSLPSITDLTHGKLVIDDLKRIDVKDLLGREQVEPNKKLLKIKISGKVVFVSGAGGSIGSELCRQIILLKPKKLVLYEISEPSLYQIDQELINFNVPNIEIIPVLGSVRDKIRMINILSYYGVQTIYHAAAYKHVPLVELNQSQGILNNAIGTKLAAEAAIASKVETFVLVSTDKAVRPSSIMGAAKRVAELVLQALANEQRHTCFTMVRFGNVLDSSGSVIPLFKKQIRNGGPVTVTHSDVVRYFMTIPEAVELVIQAGAMGNGGDVFVLDMGEPIRISELAAKMIKLSGLEVLTADNPEGDIEISYIGLRPGEKLYEELLVGENVSNTEHNLIMRAMEEMIEWDRLSQMLQRLEEASNDENEENIHEALTKIVPSFRT